MRRSDERCLARSHPQRETSAEHCALLQLSHASQLRPDRPLRHGKVSIDFGWFGIVLS